MDGCIEQWYAYVPGRVKVNVKDAPLASGSEEKAAGADASEVMVCTAPSSFVHVTVVPVFTVRTEGLNAKFLIVIVIPALDEAGGAAGDDEAGLE